VVDRDLFTLPTPRWRLCTKHLRSRAASTPDVRMFGMPFTGVMVYIDHIPDRRLAVRNSDRFERETTFTVEPEAEGCRISVDSTATLRTGLLDRLLEPLLRRERDSVVRTVRAELERPGSRVATAA
jgi:hypothetical protein